MSKFRKADIAPVFEALGAAVFEAQHLESGLQLLLTIMDTKLNNKGQPRDPAPLDRPECCCRLKIDQ